MNIAKKKSASHPRPTYRNQKEGFMEKKTGLLSMWKNRYFVLMHDVLCYFKREDQKESMTPTGRIFFNDVISIEKLAKKGRPYCFLVSEDDKKHLMSCSSDEERSSWIEAIQYGQDHHKKQEKFDPVRRKSAKIGRDFKRVTIQKDGGGGIGCTIKNVGGAIFVNRIIPDGPVAVSGVLRPGDQIVDINGIKISGSPIEKIKEVIKESPDYVVCTVKPVTHYANDESSPTLPRTAYAELDTQYLKQVPQITEAVNKTASGKGVNYATIDFPDSPDSKGDVNFDNNKDSCGNYVNMPGEKHSVQNYAELDFSRR